MANIQREIKKQTKKNKNREKNKQKMETLEKLSEKERIDIQGKTTDNLYDRMWCSLNGIDYVNPNFREAMVRTYEEMQGENK